jgi:nucleolar protein 53
MGRKTGANKRAKKRADEAAQELLLKTIENQEAEYFESKEDDELFVLDTVGKNVTSNTSRKRKATEEKEIRSLTVKQNKKNQISENDERRIRKIIGKHSKKEVLQLAAADRERMQERKRTKRGTGLAKANFDLWDHDVSNEPKKVVVAASSSIPMAGIKSMQFMTVSKSALRKDIQQPAKLSRDIIKNRELLKKSARKTIKVEPAQPGMSYRPDVEQHQDVVGEALSIELRRKEAIDYKNAPLGGGKLSDETMALIVGSSDEESSDEEDDNDMEGTGRAPVKRKEKLTRAQRNKQKRMKQEQLALQEKKRKRQLIASLSDAKKVAKEVRKEEAAKLARRQEIQALKDEERAKPIGGNIIGTLAELDPINAPSLPVALTEELKGGSLRTLKPKGSLVTDRIESFISRKMANRKAVSAKNIVHGKRRKNIKGGKDREYILA